MSEMLHLSNTLSNKILKYFVIYHAWGNFSELLLKKQMARNILANLITNLQKLQVLAGKVLSW